PVGRRSRRAGAERQPERAGQCAVQGGGHVPEGVLLPRNADGAATRDLCRSGRFRASRSRPERVRACEPAWSADRLLPRRPGVRGDSAVMANAAFLSAITVFLLVGWIAGELRFLAPYK